jgi:serine/threonine protein kinase
MEFVEGRPLDAIIPRDGLPASQAVRIAMQIATALEAAHRAGISIAT